MEPANKRKNDIRESLLDNYQLLKQWEKYLSTVTDPNQEQHARNEIRRIKALIKEQEQERQSTKTKRKRIVLVVALLLVIATGWGIYNNMAYAAPDYAEYLDQMKEGDSLVLQQKFTEARIAYKKAARYNPLDLAAGRKIALLDSADRFIKEKKFPEAKGLFNIIISIPASPTLTPAALERAGVSSNPPMQISIAWNGVKLEISISGGVPFNSEKQPYEIEGINCSDCIKWIKNSNGYLATVVNIKVQTGQLRLKDRLGQFSDGYIPSAPVSQASQSDIPQNEHKEESKTSPPPAPGVSKEEAFSGYMKAGDSLYTSKKFADARNAFVAARAIRPADAAVNKKIADCDNKILSAVKNVPRTTIQGNDFTMGTDNGNPDDGPAHAVSLRNYAIGKTEVTVSQYRDFCNYTGRQMPVAPSYGWTDEAPIVNVSWNDAMAYCEWVGGRLPTEAEWEYAASGGTTNTYSGGNRIDQVAIYNANSRGKAGKTAKKSSNGFGLFDMTGNVSEWCADWYGRKYYGQGEQHNPKGPGSGSEKVIRGGSYNSFMNSTQDGNQLRITYRNSELPAARQPYIGFRVAWDL